MATGIHSLRRLDAWQALAIPKLAHDSSTNALIRRYRRQRNGAVLKEA